MKYGIQAIHAWSERAGVDNVSRFLEGLFGLRCDAEEALEIVRRRLPDL